MNQWNTPPIEERLWSKVTKGEGCWVWTGGHDAKGYGNIRYDGRKQPVHRVAYILQNGEISDDLVVMHTCDNPPCVRGDHLVAGTQSDNIRDRDAKGRRAPGQIKIRQSHCRHNHELTDDNVYVSAKGRTCKTCHQERTASRRAKPCLSS